MNGRDGAIAALLVALVVGAVAQHVAGQEARLLGLSVLELTLLGAGAGAVARRLSH